MIFLEWIEIPAQNLEWTWLCLITQDVIIWQRIGSADVQVKTLDTPIKKRIARLQNMQAREKFPMLPSSECIVIREIECKLRLMNTEVELSNDRYDSWLKHIIITCALGKGLSHTFSEFLLFIPRSEIVLVKCHKDVVSLCRPTAECHFVDPLYLFPELTPTPAMDLTKYAVKLQQQPPTKPHFPQQLCVR